MIPFYIITNSLKCLLKGKIEMEVLYFLNIVFKLWDYICIICMYLFFSYKVISKITEFALYVATLILSSKAFLGTYCNTVQLADPVTKSKADCSLNDQFIQAF